MMVTDRGRAPRWTLRQPGMSAILKPVHGQASFAARQSPSRRGSSGALGSRFPCGPARPPCQRSKCKRAGKRVVAPSGVLLLLPEATFDTRSNIRKERGMEPLKPVVERLFGRVLLGPVPCQSCRSLITWDGMDWHFAGTMLLHRRETCPGPKTEPDDQPQPRGGLHFSKRSNA
jgi:hypothetical protein